MATNTDDADEAAAAWYAKPWPAARIQHLLLPRGTEYDAYDESGRTWLESSFGSGLLMILGSSGSGKSTMAHSLVHWVMLHHPRPVQFVGFSESWLEVLPDFIRRHASVLAFRDLHLVEQGAIVFMDDTGLYLTARRAMRKENVGMGSFMQIARHLDCLVMFTAQSTRVVDFGPSAVAEGCTVIKHYDDNALQYERDEWRARIATAVGEMRREIAPERGAKACRHLYYCWETGELGTFPVAPWIFDDRVARPMALIDRADLGELLWGSS